MAKTKARENYGRGSITPKLDKDGKQRKNKQGQLVWLVCLSFGSETVIDKNGNRKRKRNKVQKVAYGTIQEVRKYCDQLQAEYENIDHQAAQGTFSWACDKWLAWMNAKGGASKPVMRKYSTWLNYMCDYIGDRKLAEIKKSDIEETLVSIKNARNLSNTTLNGVFAKTKTVFEHAVDSDWLVRNPCKRIDAPKVDKVTSRRSLTDEEIVRLRSALDREQSKAYADFEMKEHRQGKAGNTFGRSYVRGLVQISQITAIRIMLATGMRRGEVCGLTWGAVDFENSQIYVHQSLTASVELKDPKTFSGKRALYVEQNTLDHLKKWKEYQAKAIHLVMPDGLAVTQTDETPVCCSSYGDWLDPNHLSRWWRGYGRNGETHQGFRDAIGFPDLNMHELRHTQATMLLGNGVDVKSVQTRLGHSRASVTLDQYAHAIPANDKAAADLMGAIMNKQKKANVVQVEKTA